ncbi:hypothetical protein O4G76_14925 [Limimaricola sp. G21655-S1]|uniref:hypothetical protein n=1 Tax=Limimaricola sp. G21655-S1 TaxID=3014768 RepID=UPI0022AF514A|nr:hypothetical protein [Limimaricola sp. G21655-S1]MCZ4262137.1 hypothetical protein [Limimaricola sp. G21655-S1]
MLRMGVAGPELQPSGGSNVNADCMSLSEDVVTSLRLKGDGKGISFLQAAERAGGYVIDARGNKTW